MNDQRSGSDDDGSWWKAGPDGKIPPLKILWLGLLAAAISFVVLYSGNVGLKGYYGLFNGEPFPESEWWRWLYWLSLGGAGTIGALTAAWRLIYRIEGQAHWGMALTLIAAVLFAFLVWPTPWMYRQYGCTVYQINRFYGNSAELTTIPSCEPAAQTYQAGS